MTAQRIDVRGRLPAEAADAVGALAVGLRLQTVLGCSLRDQAAMHGLLRRLEDLGIDLVELRRMPDEARQTQSGGTERRPATSSGPLAVEIVIKGPVGDLALFSLSEQAPVTLVRTTLELDDSIELRQLLIRLLDAGAEIERVTDSTASSDPAESTRSENVDSQTEEPP